MRQIHHAGHHVYSIVNNMEIPAPSVSFGAFGGRVIGLLEVSALERTARLPFPANAATRQINAAWRQRKSGRYRRLMVSVTAGVAARAVSSTCGQKLTTLFSFNGTDGSEPNPLVQGPDGSFYGVTMSGGMDNSCSTGAPSLWQFEPSTNGGTARRIDEHPMGSSCRKPPPNSNAGSKTSTKAG
jgi:sugar lactone lactonase YvrE